jgi:DNA-binding response OmpR family regulator
MASFTASASVGGVSKDPVKKGTILVVDDELIIQEMVCGRLMLEQYVVFSAESAEKALALLDRITPDLIILDISMPGMGGFGFLKRLADATPHAQCPVIIFTGRHQLESFFKETPIAAFLAKTTDPELLVRKVKEMILPHRGSVPDRREDASRRLVLVEDDAFLCHHLSIYFTRHGFAVQGHDGGDTLLTTVSLHQPSLIILKYMLPHHNGPTLAEKLWNNPSTQDIPVILYDETATHQVIPYDSNVKLLVPSSRDYILLEAIHRVVGVA